LRVQVMMTNRSSRSRVPGQLTARLLLLPVQVTLPSVDDAVSETV
jgi:hypothetical protein